ncbi:MAG: hypothetical protein EBQ96_08055 [Proteobacteria bacterium]|nr:hypothetical protein [Pseudomonadota bacterium]
MQLARQRFEAAGILPAHFGADAYCGQNPMDVTPVALAVYAQIVKMLPIARRLGKKVIVVFGENHNIPTHVVAGKATLDLARRSLGDHAKIAVNFEMRHNTQSVLLSQQLNTPRPLLDWLSLHDTTGHEQIKTILAFGAHEESPVTRRDFYAYLLEKNVPTKFVDAAFIEDERTGEAILDLYDPQTRRLVVHRRRGMPDSLDIPVYSANGMADRNYIMAINTCLNMKQTSADLGFLFCGNDHVIGNTEAGHKFSESATAYLAASGHIVIPVFNQHYLGFSQDIPLEARDIIRQGVIIRGLDPSIYEIGDETDELFHFEDVLENSSRVVGPSQVPDTRHLGRTVLLETQRAADILRRAYPETAVRGPYEGGRAPAAAHTPVQRVA